MVHACRCRCIAGVIRRIGSGRRELLIYPAEARCFFLAVLACRLKLSVTNTDSLSIQELEQLGIEAAYGFNVSLS